MQDVADKIIANSIKINKNNVKNNVYPKTYLKNEIEHCSICDEKRQYELNIRGKKQLVPVLRKCINMQKENERQFIEEMRKDEIRKCNILFPQFRNIKFDTDTIKTKEVNIAKKYCEKWQGMYAKNHGLLLLGNPGVGKSYIADCIANYLIDNDVSVYMTNFNNIINDIQTLEFGKNTSNNTKIKLVDRLMSYACLIINDFGVEADTTYRQQNLYDIVNKRVTSGKPLILTTNLTLEQLNSPNNMMESRIYSRIFEMCCPIEFKGENIRKMKTKTNYNDFIELIKR